LDKLREYKAFRQQMQPQMSDSAAAAAAVDAPFRTFMCVVCGFIYNEAEGWPADGIEPGTRWEDIPETWTCPDCGVTKSDFEMMQI
jgi:rubredoxin